MWHQIPNSVTKTHKGWLIQIYKASKWNKHLKVTLTPIITPNTNYIETLPSELKSKLYKAIFALPDKYQHNFEVANLYPLIHPWGEATNKAYQYINEKLGKFDVEKAMQEIKL